MSFHLVVSLWHLVGLCLILSYTLLYYSYLHVYRYSKNMQILPFKLTNDCGVVGSVNPIFAVSKLVFKTPTLGVPKAF